MESIAETAIICRGELQRALRSGRVIVLLALYAVFSLLVLLVIGAIVNALTAQMNQQLSQMGGEAATAEQLYEQGHNSVLGFLVSGDAMMIEALQQVPLVVLIVFKVTLFFLPAYIALMGFDQMSGEVGSRSIRYLAIRARRASILFGKVLAQAILLLGLVLTVDLGIFIYAKVTNSTFTLPQMGIHLAKFWLAAIVFSMAYLALTSLCSALTRSTVISLILNLLALFVFWLVDIVGKADPSKQFLRYFSPSNYANNLLHPALGQFALSAAAYLVFAAIFFAAAYLVVRARDL